MKKIIPIFLFFLCILMSSKAMADIDVMASVGQIQEGVQKGVETAVEAQKQVEQANTYKAEFDEKIKMKPQFLTVPKISVKIPKDFSNLNKTSNTEKEINDKFLLKDNRIQDYKERDSKIEGMKREKLVSAFAQAFTTRTNISIEKEEKTDRKDTQDIIAATNAKLLSIAKRQAQILALENVYSEFLNIDASQKQTADGGK